MTGVERARLGLLALGLNACAPAPEQVALDGRAFELGFAVTEAADGAALRISPVFVVEGGASRSGRPPGFVLEPGEVGAVFVGVAERALRALEPELDAAALGAVQVRLGTLSAPDEAEVQGDRAWRALPLPAEVLLLELGSERSRDRRPEVHLRVPLRRRSCGEGPVERLVPAGPEARVLPPEGEPLAGELRTRAIRQIHSLPDGRVVVRTSVHVVLLDAELRPVPSSTAAASPSVVHVAALGDAGASIQGSAAVEGPEGPEVVLTGEVGGIGAVWRVRITADGLVPVGRARLEPPDPPVVRAAVEDHTGRSLVFTDSGLVYARAVGVSAFVLAGRLNTGREVPRALALADPERPHLAVSHDGQAYRGDLTTSRVQTDLLSNGVTSLHFYALAATPSADEIWIGGWRGLMFRARGGGQPFEPLELRLPASYAACASIPDGQLRIGRRIDDFAILGPDLYVVIEECTGVLRVRRRDLCTGSIAGANGVERSVDRSIHGLGVHRGRLLAGDRQGRLWAYAPPSGG